MGKLGYTSKLLREFIEFARYKKAYWIIPLALFLGLMGFLAVAGQTAAPLIYTMF